MAHAIKVSIEMIIEPDEGGYHVFCPALKGLHVDGATIKEAKKNAKDAAIAYLRSLVKHGDPIPLGVLEELEPFLKRRESGKKKLTHYTEEFALASL